MLFFQIEGWQNRIMLYDGSDDQSILISELFGTPNNKFVKTISSSGKFMFIDFKKPGTGNSYNPIVEFVSSIKYNKINPDCQSWMDNNILMSPNNLNINCSWIISRKFGSYITLDFSFIEVNLMNIKAKNALI